MIEQLQAIKQYADAKRQLKELEVIRSESVTGEIAEFYLIKLFGGVRAPKAQKGWDVTFNDEHVQIKGHAKDQGNSTRRTELKAYDPNSPPFHRLYIFVFSQNLILKEIRSCEGKPFAAGRQKVEWDKLRFIRLDELRSDEFLTILLAQKLIALEDPATAARSRRFSRVT